MLSRMWSYLSKFFQHTATNQEFISVSSERYQRMKTHPALRSITDDDSYLRTMRRYIEQNKNNAEALNIHNKTVLSALHQAVNYGDIAAVKILIDAGVDVNKINSHCAYSPLAIAASHGDVEITRLLLKNKNININIPHDSKISPTSSLPLVRSTNPLLAAAFNSGKEGWSEQCMQIAYLILSHPKFDVRTLSEDMISQIKNSSPTIIEAVNEAQERLEKAQKYTFLHGELQSRERNALQDAKKSPTEKDHSSVSILRGTDKNIINLIFGFLNPWHMPKQNVPEEIRKVAKATS